MVMVPLETAKTAARLQFQGGLIVSIMFFIKDVIIYSIAGIHHILNLLSHILLLFALVVKRIPIFAWCKASMFKLQPQKTSFFIQLVFLAAQILPKKTSDEKKIVI